MPKDKPKKEPLSNDIVKDLRPKGSILTNSRWGNSDCSDYDAPRPDPISQSSLCGRFFDQAASGAERVFSTTLSLDEGKTQKLTWTEAAVEVARVAFFLKEKLGVKKGDRVAILSYTRAEWAITDLAILSLGAVSTPIYHSLTDSEAAYVLWNSQADIVFCENQAQLEKLAEIDSSPSEIPSNEIFAGGEVQLSIKALIAYEEVESEQFQARLYSFKDIINSGRYSNAVETSEIVEIIRKEASQVQRDDLASIVYTSGTTGVPKGVMQTHENHLSLLEGLILSGLIGSGNGIFLFLPLAHSFARFIFYGAMVTGGDLIFPAIISRKESEFDAKQLFSDIRESNPTILPSVPRIYEKVMTAIQGKTSAAGFLRRPVVSWAIDTWQPLTKKNQEAKLNFLERISHKISGKIVSKIKRSVFGTNLSHCVSGGAPLDEKVSRFFDSLGIVILEGYGLTETTPALSANSLLKNAYGSVGRVFKGVEVKLAADGELLARGPNVAIGYNRMPKATAKAWSEDGWFSTGDIAEIDAEGFIRITDRKKDLIVNAGGKNIAPQKIEGKLKTIPYVSQALVFGDRKPYLVGLLTLDSENTLAWAKRTFPNQDNDLKSLSENPKLRELLDDEITIIHEDLASYEEIKRYRILVEDFTIENGLLSPTLKLKRKKVVEKYLDTIEGIYRA